MVIKAPRTESESISRPGLVIRANLAYAEMETALGLGLVCQIEDDPARPFQADTYFDLAKKDVHRLAECLIRQKRLKFLILDETLAVLGAKQITWGTVQRAEAVALLAQALAYRLEMPDERYDFARAKAEFQARYSLEQLLGLSG